jgi:hypothetical protein
MARSWAFIALVMSAASVCAAVFNFFTGMIDVAFLSQGLMVLCILLATISWISYLLFLETVAETMGERGIADSINATIKAAGTFCFAIVLGMGAQMALVAYITSHGRPGFMAGNDPTVFVFEACHGAFSAFTAILGLVVFIRYVGALINVRRMIEWRL